VSRWPGEFAAILVLMIVTVAVLAPLTLRWITILTIVPDQPFHLRVAIEMMETGTLKTPHFLYQALVIGIHALAPDAGWTFSAAAANLLPQAFSAAILYAALRATSAESAWGQAHVWRARALSAALALGLLVIVPLFGLAQVFSIDISPMLLGTVTPTTYHNPTVTALRPFALGLFLWVTTFALGPHPALTTPLRVAAVTALTGLTVLVCGLGKPNYLIALLPALGLWVGWRLLMRRPNAWVVAVLGVAIPGALFLAWQYYFTYLNPTANLMGSGIIFAPFAVVWEFAAARSTLLLYFAVSFLYPLAVTTLHWHHARRDSALLLAWLTFAFGTAFMYLLAESGHRQNHGNFLWGAYISAWLLHFAAARLALRVWLRQTRPARDWRTLVLTGVFLLYVVSGIQFIEFSNQWLLARV
jgi:hypothetical protein